MYSYVTNTRNRNRFSLKKKESFFETVMAAPYVNGVTLAKRKDKFDLEKLYTDNFRRGSPETIVTIDYGTTYCSVYYALYPKEDLVPLIIDQSGSQRVPNCLLFSEDGRLMRFGAEASDLYADTDEQERKKFYYFEHVKLFFRHQVYYVLAIPIIIIYSSSHNNFIQDQSQSARRRITALNEVSKQLQSSTDSNNQSLYLVLQLLWLYLVLLVYLTMYHDILSLRPN